MLQRAVEGATDEEIARDFAMSLSIVKKRFRGAYRKVLDSPGHLPIQHADANCGSRGAELRRRLLNYLRDHPEELTPYNAAPEKGALRT